ncbi:MAG: SRPBCC family protein [Actinomycetes bacterium]
MSEASKNSIQIDAPLADVAALLFDPAGYPEWSTAIKSASVLEKDGEGRATKIEMMIKAGQVKDRVILDYDWSKAPNALTFALDDADMLTEMTGGYTLTDNGDDTTKVEYELTVALSMPVPAMMRTKAERDTIDLALKELKAKLED